MVHRAPFLTQPYSAYYHREVPADDVELTRVGPGTPCGEYMRRFWHPVAFSDELRDLPKAIRILGEDLVMFRDFQGRVGLLEAHCPHRGTSLEFGLVSERGIRCCYHGWLFDIDGRILETPGEPAHSTLKDRLCHGAYPTREHKGLVFAYMGPLDRKPAFRILDTFALPGYRCLPGRKHIIPCNWLQIKDNAMDPAHTYFLHTIVSGAQFSGEFGVVPEVEWMETSCGMAYVATRRVGEHVWVRTSDFIPPNLHQFPRTWEKATEEKVFGRPYMTIWAVPLDDTHTMNTGYLHIPNDMEVDEQRLHALKESVGQTGAGSYEERQRRPGDFEAQVSQRPIAVHALEHLAGTDRGVIMLRKLVRDGIRATASGKDPAGVTRGEGQVIRTYAQDTVIKISPGATAEAERRQLLGIGRRVMDDFYVKNPPASITRDALHASGVA
jgi:phenylpropionate dioxygenase-like ring-hydroxylating dioxygenase large terminal subunit